jgi:hypothetical protein
MIENFKMNNIQLQTGNDEKSCRLEGRDENKLSNVAQNKIKKARRSKTRKNYYEVCSGI